MVAIYSCLIAVALGCLFVVSGKDALTALQREATEERRQAAAYKVNPTPCCMPYTIQYWSWQSRVKVH